MDFILNPMVAQHFKSLADSWIFSLAGYMCSNNEKQLKAISLLLFNEKAPQKCRPPQCHLFRLTNDKCEFLSSLSFALNWKYILAGGRMYKLPAKYTFEEVKVDSPGHFVSLKAFSFDVSLFVLGCGRNFS